MTRRQSSRPTRVVAIFAALFLLTLAGASCRREKKAEIEDSLESKGTMELLRETAKDKWTPPADGRLTDAQIEMYIKVRERERDIARVVAEKLKTQSKKVDEAGEKSVAGLKASFEAMSSVADFVTADIRAAKELGFNTQEYLWVKGKVLEVSMGEFSKRTLAASEAALDQSYTTLKAQYDATTDEAQKKMLGESLKAYEQQKAQNRAEVQNVDPAYTHNMELLAKHEATLNALTAELSKFEEKEGDAEKSMKDWEKGIDKAFQQAVTDTTATAAPAAPTP